MMKLSAQDPHFETRVRESFQRQAIMRFLGAELMKLEPGFCEIHLPYRRELSQQHGYFHGGITSTIADSAGGYAAFSLMPANASVLTVEYKINLLARADGELLVAIGQVVRPGRTITVCRLDVYARKGESEKLCATGLQSIICLPGEADSIPQEER